MLTANKIALLLLFISMPLLLLLFPVPGNSQDQPAVNCTTIEQCRTLVLVARGQLLSAQDAWAFWADKAQELQKQLEKLQKESKKEDSNAKSE